MSEDQTLNLSDFAKVIDFNSLYQSYTEARKGKSFSTVFAIMSWNRTFRKLSYTTTTQARKAKERTSDLTA